MASWSTRSPSWRTARRPWLRPETDLTADVDAILACVTPRTRLVFIANPNNPTGTYLPFDEVKRLREGLPPDVLLVLDAAYAEYVRKNDYESGIELVATTPNTVMTRTFSKIYGLASLRIGWAYCPTEIADALNRIRGPFNVSGPAIAAGVAALEDQAWVQFGAEHNEVWRGRMAEALANLGLGVTPSAANFLLLHFPSANGRSAQDADKFLHAQRIILRRVEEYGLPDCLRMTIGTEEESRAAIDALTTFMGGNGAVRDDQASVRPIGHHRPWPDRLVHHARRPRARRRARDRGAVAFAPDAGARR